MTQALVRRPVFPNDFRVLFRTLARCAVASSFGLAASCASTTLPNGEAGGGAAAPNMMPLDAASPSVAPDAALPGEWVPLLCDDEGGMWSLEDTSLQPPPDYLAIYASSFNQDDRASPLVRVDNVRTTIHGGTACIGAPNGTECAANLQRRLDETTCANNPCPPFLIAITGDAVSRIESAALGTLLGPVDSEVEAAIAAGLGDAAVFCWSETDMPPSANGTHMRAIEGGYEVETLSSCYGDLSSANAAVDAMGNVAIVKKLDFCEGRRPEGLVSEPCRVARTEVGAHFASSAHFEAASVFAFEQLARDLERLAAPRELIELALRAALDEVGHARAMAALTVRFGGALVSPRIAPPEARDALAIALENAVEGCVRETYGAVVACFQAEAARDPHVRAAMTQIAEDETRHAQLSWKIAQWLEPLLTQAERSTVHAARLAAYVQLRGSLAPVLSTEARHVVGLPDEATSLALLSKLGAALDLIG